MSVDCKTVWANLITGDIRGAPVSSSWQQLRPGCASVKTAQLQPVVQPPWPTMSWRAKDACQCVRDICPWCTTQTPMHIVPSPTAHPTSSTTLAGSVSVLRQPASCLPAEISATHRGDCQMQPHFSKAATWQPPPCVLISTIRSCPGKCSRVAFY